MCRRTDCPSPTSQSSAERSTITLAVIPTATTFFVVEVAVSSLATDRVKGIEYARAGVPVYWLVDVTGRRLEIHSQDPTPRPRDTQVTTILDETRDVEIPETSERVSIAELLKR